MSDAVRPPQHAPVAPARPPASGGVARLRLRLLQPALLLLLFGAALLLALGGAVQAGDQAAADLSRGALLGRIRARTHAHPKTEAADRARWEATLKDSQTFTHRFPGDPARAEVLLATGRAAVRLSRPAAALAPLDRLLAEVKDARLRLPGLFLRGLAYAEQGATAKATADLEALRQDEETPCGIRERATHVQAGVLAQAGQRDAAMALLRRLVEGRPEDAALARAAEADLRDLVRVGGPVPTLPNRASLAQGTVVCVLRRRGTGESLLREAAAAVRGLEAKGARVLDLAVAGFDDPNVRAFRPPTLPRIYVVGSRDGRRLLLAAGVRREAVRAAVETALGAAGESGGGKR